MAEIWKRARDFYVYATAWNMGSEPEPHLVRARKTQSEEWDRMIATVERAAAAKALTDAANRIQPRDMGEGIKLELQASAEAYRREGKE